MPRRSFDSLKGQCVKFNDIRYTEGARGTLDIYRPRGADGAPVIVFFYGGRWSSGRKGLYHIFGRALRSRGYVVVIPDYRIYPEVRFPSFVEDGARAVRWTRDNIAEYGGDPRRLFVMGHSAGAHIAAMLSFDPQWLQRVGLDANRDITGLIGLAGPYDFLPFKDADLIEIFDGADRPETQPINFAHGRKPPALLVSGGKDKLVHFGNSTRLAERLRQGGNDATALLYRRLGHITVLAGYAPFLWNFLSAMRDLDAFIERVAKGAASRPVLLTVPVKA
jgi:acetyl esterase/lipase